MAGKLRPGDAREAEQAGMTQYQALTYGVAHSLWARTALIDDNPAAIWGLVVPNILGPVAHPWLLTTHAVERHKKRLVREAFAAVLAKCALRYPECRAA